MASSVARRGHPNDRLSSLPATSQPMHKLPDFGGTTLMLGFTLLVTALALGGLVSAGWPPP